MQIIDTQLLDSLTKEAQANPRLRMNHNFHKHLDDPLNRFLNAMEPCTYIPPHRHINPDKEDIFIVLRGKLLLFIFHDDGIVKDAIEVSPSSGVYGMEIKAGTWHSLLVLETGSVVYEIKRGSYVPVSAENLAPWAPHPEDKKACAKYMNKLLKEYQQ